ASTTATAAGIVIQSSVQSRPMLVGGTNSSPVAGINLTSAELAQIFTTSSGTVTIGDGQQTGNITFSTATPATTAGASVNVIESSTGGGAIILDDDSGAGTGLSDNAGYLSLSPGTGGVQTTLCATGTPIVADGITISGALNVTLGLAPTAGMQLTLINNTATTGDVINGTFSNLSQGGTYTASYLGTSYTFQANYDGGDGNDLMLTLMQDSGPTVVGAFVSGSAWNASYLSLLAAAGLGNSGLGFELASGANQLTTMLPWTNVTQISIAFSEPVTLSQASLTLYNSANMPISVSSYSYNSSTYVATWQFSAPLAADKYVMNLAANSVSDAAGTALDGAWTTGVSTFAAGSGDGTPGGDFNFYFNVVPGDANNSGTVTNGDVLDSKLQVGAVSNSSNYRDDVNASNNVTNGDVLLEKLQVGSNINSFPTPQLPPQSVPAAAPSDATPSAATPDNVLSSPAALATVGSGDSSGSSVVVISPAAAFVVPTLAPAAVMASVAGKGLSLASGSSGDTSAASDPDKADDAVLAAQPALAAIGSSIMLSSASSTPMATASAPISPLVSTTLTMVLPVISVSFPAEPAPADAVSAVSPVADVLFQSLAETSAPAAPALDPSDALALALAHFDRTSSQVAFTPLDDVADNVAPTSLPAHLTAAAWTPATPLALDEVFSDGSAIAADEFSAVDSALTAGTTKLAMIVSERWL
ncbi:MAG TPA: hypothetical protein VIK18_26350, partial [Pirellulales bacterium]